LNDTRRRNQRSSLPQAGLAAPRSADVKTPTTHNTIAATKVVSRAATKPTGFSAASAALSCRRLWPFCAIRKLPTSF